MPTTKVIDIIARCNAILYDALKVRWPNEELLDWFNAGQVAIVTVRPDAYTERAEHTCTLGAEQALPDSAIRLVRAVRNAGGSALKFMSMDELDYQIPDWHDDSEPVTDCEFYSYLDQDPRRFYLYPAPETGHKVVLIFSRAPERVAADSFDFDSSTKPIDLPDTYADPLVDYVLYRAFSKDSDFANGQRASAHYSAMMAGIQGKTEADAGMSPANG